MHAHERRAPRRSRTRGGRKRDPERAAEVAAELGRGVQALSHEALAGSDDVEAVVLCCRHAST